MTPLRSSICFSVSANVTVFGIIIFAAQTICEPVASATNLFQGPAWSAAINAAKLVVPDPEAVAVLLGAS